MSDPWRSGDPVLGQKCPRCRKEEVVYNGNYFCVACDWAMGEAGRPARIIVAYLEQRYAQAQAKDDVSEMEHMARYLREHGVDVMATEAAKPLTALQLFVALSLFLTEYPDEAELGVQVQDEDGIYLSNVTDTDVANGFFVICETQPKEK